jgi:hypothetical protein
MNRVLALRLASVATASAAGALAYLGGESTAAAQNFGAPPPPQQYTVQAGPTGGYVSGGNVRARYDATTNPAEKFSRQGHLAISNDAQFGFTVQGNNAAGSTTGVAFVVKPAADYFVIDNLSVGGYVRLGFANDAGANSGLNDGGNTTFGIGARVGYNIPVMQNFSIWPRAGLGVNTASRSTTVAGVDVSASQTNLTLNLSVPFLVHPVDHYFLGLAPALDVDLTGDVKSTAFTINFVVGGWVL